MSTSVVLTGVGGQGTVLASKLIANAAMARGLAVHTAETIGMAQRGGNVTSHVRMGDGGEEVLAPLIATGCANLVIALEVGEAVRALPYLAADGLLVCGRAAIPSVVTNLSGAAYDADGYRAYLERQAPHFLQVDERVVCEEVGSPKVANVALLAAAVLACGRTGWGLGDAIGKDDLTQAIAACVRPQFLDANVAAVDAVARTVGQPT